MDRNTFVKTRWRYWFNFVLSKREPKTQKKIIKK